MPSGTSSRPDQQHFIVIGSMKSGTTTLYHQLLGQPQFGMSRIKETNYFIAEKNWSRGQDWYENLFDSDAVVTGEISPAYTKHDIFQGVPERIANYQPATKLIYLVRDPVQRFMSHYRHAVQMGHTNVSPEDLLSSRNGQHMLETSRYAAQLETYLKVFPEEQICILDFDELTQNPQSVLNRITVFLGIDQTQALTNLAFNDASSVAAMPKTLQRMRHSRKLSWLESVIPSRAQSYVKRVLSYRKVQPVPPLPSHMKKEIALALEADAQRFRDLTGIPFDDWTV